MQRPFAVSIFCAVVLAAATQRLDAAVVTYAFSGTLNSATAQLSGDPFASPLPGAAGADGKGDPFTGTLSFDDQASFFDHASGVYRYLWSIGTVTLDIGGYLYSFIRYGTNPDEQFVGLYSPVAPNEQLFSLDGQDGDPGTGADGVSLGLVGQTGFLSSSDTLAGLTLDTSLFIPGPEASGVTLGGTFGHNPDSFQIDATITQLSLQTPSTPPSPAVPEPATLILFGQAMLLAGARRWRRQPCRDRNLPVRRM
ncbi:MAG TPA: PEP-CTERM sorting domain-containing protein [Pirellulales bacterium]|nr:PEP-CTERM sorting domain-containing protein [Pirellulales bacterium]